MMSMEYKEFLERKAQTIPCCGFTFQKAEMNRNLFDWQKDIVSWSLKKAKRRFLKTAVLARQYSSLNGAASFPSTQECRP